MVAGAVLAEDDDGIASCTPATDLRTRIIGLATVYDVAGDRADMIFNTCNRQLGKVRRRVVGIHRVIIGLDADVSCSIGCRNRKVMMTFGKRNDWCVAPGSIGIGNRFTQLQAVIVDDDLGTGFRLTGKDRLGVIGHTTSGNNPLDFAHIVVHRIDARLDGGTVVSGDAEDVRDGAGISSSVGRSDSEVMLAFGDRGGWRIVPLT